MELALRYNNDEDVLSLKCDADTIACISGAIAENFYGTTGIKNEKDILRKAGTPHEYHFREGAIAFPDSLEKPARTMLTSEGSLNRSTHVIEDPKSKCYRILTPLETERINGFPDEWTNTGMPESFRYFCMGNALVVGIIERLGKEIENIIEKED